MRCISALWGGDLRIGPTGDILAIPAGSEVDQRLIRRLLTNSGDYIWNIAYGGGLGEYVGKPFSPEVLQDVILQQMKLETSIQQDPQPIVVVAETSPTDLNTISVSISYKPTGFEVTNTMPLSISG
jgi:hypothetical protein